MCMVKRILKRIRMFYTRNIVLGLCLCIFVFSSGFSFYIENLWAKYGNAFATMDGTTIWVTTEDPQQNIPDDIVCEIKDIPHITGYNCVFDTNVVIENIDINQSGNLYENGKQFVVSANTDTSATEDFAFGRCKLAAGKFPQKGENEILIEENFSKEYALQVGTELILQDCSAGEIVTFYVSGIYASGNVIKDILYADFDDVKNGFNLEMKKNKYIFNVDKYENVEDVKKKVEKVLPKESGYTFNDSISNAAQGFSAFSNSLEDIKKILINVTYISGLIIIFCVSFLWMRDHVRDAGIYIALGRKKTSILLEFILEIVVVSMGAMVSSSIAAYVVIENNKNKWMSMLLHYINPLGEFQEVDKQMLQEKMPWEILGKTDGLILVVVCVAALLAGSIILRYTNRELLLTKNE